MAEPSPFIVLAQPDAACEEEILEPAPFVGLWDSRGTFRPEGLTDLPEAAQLYLQHAIAPGTVLATSVKLQMHGEIKLRKWRKFTAEQIIHRTHEFVWRAKTRISGIPVRGIDRLVDGKGATRWKAFGLFPVMGRSGPRFTRSAAGRSIAESIWLPSTLCGANVRWTAITPRRPHAHIFAQREWTELALRIDEDGRLERLTVQRWGNPAGGAFRYHPFGAVIEAEDTFRGYTIPSRMRIGYFAGSPRFDKDGEFLRITLDNATFL